MAAITTPYSLTSLSDNDVIKLVLQSGEMTMIEALYNRYSDKVYRKCMTFVKQRAIAQDLVHDIFLKVYLNLHTYKFSSTFSTWLYIITRNRCIDYLRDNRKHVIISVDHDDYDIANMLTEQEVAIYHLEIEELFYIFDKIKLEERQILFMKYKYGLSINDIMVLYNLSESATKMRIKRARDKVRRLYFESFPPIKE